MMRSWRTILLVACLGLLLTGCSWQRGYEAYLFLQDVAAGEGSSSLKEKTPLPVRQGVSFEVDGRTYEADIYLSPQGVRAGVLLLPGAAERGKDDPRLVAFANSLARVRFAVLIPDLESTRTLKVNPGNITEFRDCFAYLAGRSDLAPEGRAGMVAFSYAAGPAILAALDPSIGQRVHFIMAVGGYHDLPAVLNFFTTGYFEKKGSWTYMEPNAYGKWVFVESNLHRLSEPEDRERFSAMADRRKRDPAAPLEDLAEGLTEEGEDLYAYITNRDRQKSNELLEALPEAIQEDVDALNLADKDLSRLRARLILIHGVEDNIIPYPQSLELAKAAREGGAKVYIVSGLFHVDIQPGWLSRWRLLRAIMALLKEQEG